MDEPGSPAPNPADQPNPANSEHIPTTPTNPNKSNKKKILIIVVIAVVLLGLLVMDWWAGRKNPVTVTDNAATNALAAKATNEATTANDGHLTLDTSKNYGNKYANGLLPVGDGKYDSAAKKGYIYTCSTYANNLTSGQGGGASQRGPWFTNNNTEYDINKKSHIAGNVVWQASFSNTVSGDARTIVTNDLPSHHTGTFPVTSSDPAYAYDRNPNTIKGQSLTYSLSANPTYGDPQCMGGQVGVMLTGVAIFNGFDAGGRDAGAWEVQDTCDGHPEKQGEYHYHTLSACITDTSVQTVIGYALDGFPITGPKVGANNYLTTSDLDECHGITSQVMKDGKLVTTYHYVMTQDFPYSASCFRAKAIDPPGMPTRP